MRNQINAATLGLVEALDQGYGDGIGLDLAKQLFAEVGNELVGHHEDQDVGILGSLNQVGHSHLFVKRGNKKDLSNCFLIRIKQKISHSEF